MAMKIQFHFSEVGGRPLYRLLVKDTAGEMEAVLLNETVPAWVVNIVVDKNLPQFIKISFYLLPHATSGVKSLKKYVTVESIDFL